MVNLAKFLAMSVHCAIAFKDEVKRTSNQNGQNPKWNENFTFDITDDRQKYQIEFTVYHKPLFLSEEKVGKTVFLLHKLSQYNYTDWFILKNEKEDVIGSILICITIDEQGNRKLVEEEKDENLDEEEA